VTNDPPGQPIALIGIAILGLGALLLIGKLAPRSAKP
jgi:hypothetical protein